MTSVLTHFVFWFSSTFLSEFVLVQMKELKNSFNWGSFFWLTLFWGCPLKFLSILIILVSWGAVFDLEIPSWLLLDTKLSNLFFHFVFHYWVLVIVLLGSPLNSSDGPGNYFLEILSISSWTVDKLVTFSIFLCYLKLSQFIRVTRKLFFREIIISFWTFDKLVTFYIFPCYLLL